MSTPIIEDIKKLLPSAPDYLLIPLERLLDLIDCPEDFRGLKKVHATIEYLFSIGPEKISTLFELDELSLSELLNLFSGISDIFYTEYSNKSHGKGWISQRPIYSLLFIFYDHRTPEAGAALTYFLEHYIKHEPEISFGNRNESSVRAFRLLYTDLTIDRSCFATDSLNETITNIFNIREILKEENDDDNSSVSSRISYLYDLEHFYRLDWKKRFSRPRTSEKTIRSSFSRNKIERVVGSESLYTASLNKQDLKKYLIDAGVTATEDYPELSIVKTEQPKVPKPKHELPDISVIKDTAKIRQKNRTISRDVRRSHNITSLSRSLLQPHELSCLWQELSNTRSSLINNIPLNNIKFLLIFILFTGRKLDAVCDLPIDHDAKMEGMGLVVTPDKLQLKVAPKPTAEMGLHSKNPNLLKTKMVATITLPTFLFQRFTGCGLQNRYQTLSGQFSVNKYRKAIESFLKKLNQRHNCQISLQRIEYFLSNVMMAEENFDPVILEILSGESSYYSRSPRHYAWYSEFELNQRIQALWENIFTRIQLYNPQFEIPLIEDMSTCSKDELGIGSQYTPCKAAIADWVLLYQAKLRQFTAFDVVKKLSTLIDYHNQYTIYTLILLINASGYRAVYNPLPSFDLFLLRYHALCISDKDSSKTFSHTRIVACPSVLMEQLRYYREHVQTLANLTSHLLPQDSFHLYAQCCDHQFINLTTKKERLDWFLSVKNSQSNDGLFLLFLQDKHNKEEGEDTSLRSKNPGPKLLSEFIDLPLNFGRHYVRRYLQCKKMHQELIKFQLGHWVAGETPLEKHSSLIHQDAIAQLLPVLDEMIAELGWQAIPSLFTRKRA